MIVGSGCDRVSSGCDGYPKLSGFMSTYPEHAIFCGFRALNVQNLLYMQAEITRLEAELQEIAIEDRHSGDEARYLYHRSWWELSQGTGEKYNNTQWTKVLEIRDKLEKYNATLLQNAEVFKLQKPRGHDLRILRKWLQAPEYGNFFLRGTEAQVWDQQNEGDLMALSHRSNEQDIFSRWLAESFMRYFHQSCWYRMKKPLPGDVESGLANYQDTHMMTAANVISTILAAMLPTVCIFVLYFVKSPLARLGAIMGFSAAFSSTLAIFTKARRVEVFAATAA
ncbi:MAG: hypothetical protein M1812_005350 [Candelaria pacifica]|nr:MAG: hypothetical protein M1812_005350 [Candelaria pacifica]